MVTGWRTHRLELDDQTLREWDAAVLDAGPDWIVLDRSAFYPGGGGQPPDHGVLLWGGVQTRIEGARKGDDLYLIPAGEDPVPAPGTPVRGAVEDARRTALMRTHSGLHVLCGVVFRDYGSPVTGGNAKSTYLTTIYGLIVPRLHVPAVAHAYGRKLSGAVSFSVDGRGRLRQRFVSAGSGSVELDEAAMQAVAEASHSFPPPPHGAPVGMTFTYTVQ